MKHLLIIVSILLLPSLRAQAQERWWHFVPGWIADKSIELNGNYLTAGIRDRKINDTLYKEVMELTLHNPKGEVIKSRYAYFDSLNGVRYYGTETSDNDCMVLCGDKIYFAMIVGSVIDGKTTLEGFVATLDTSLNGDTAGRVYPVIRKVIKTGAYNTKIYSMLPTERGLLVASYYYNNFYHQYFTSVTCLDSNFQQLWKKDFWMSINDDFFPQQLVEDGEGGYLLVCQREIAYHYVGANVYWQYIFRLDSMGNTLWTLPIKSDSFAYYNTRIAPVGKGEFMGVYTDPYTNGSIYPEGYNQQINPNSSMIVFQFNLNGKIEKNVKVSPAFLKEKFNVSSFTAMNSDIQEGKDSSIYISGNYVEYNFYAYLIKLNKQGELAWVRGYDLLPENEPDGGYSATYPYTLTATSDNGFVLTGEYQSTPSNLFPKGTQQGLVIKVDSLGCLEGGCDQWDGIQEGKPQQSFSIYPNPVHSLLYISTSQGVSAVRIFDMNGRLIKEEKQPLFPISVRMLPNGLYILQVLKNEGVQSEKFLKE